MPGLYWRARVWWGDEGGIKRGQARRDVPGLHTKGRDSAAVAIYAKNHLLLAPRPPQRSQSLHIYYVNGIVLVKVEACLQTIIGALHPPAIGQLHDVTNGDFTITVEVSEEADVEGHGDGLRAVENAGCCAGDGDDFGI